MNIKQKNARELRQQGYTYRAISEILGVSDVWAYALCNDKFRESLDERSKAWLRSGICPECAGPMTKPVHGTYRGLEPYKRCASCDAKRKSDVAFAFAVRDETILCGACRTRRPYADFSAGKRNRYLERKGKKPTCRPCETAARRAYRERNKVPCATCGTPRYHPSETGSQGSLRDTGLCLDCYRARAA